VSSVQFMCCEQALMYSPIVLYAAATSQRSSSCCSRDTTDLLSIPLRVPHAYTSVRLYARLSACGSAFGRPGVPEMTADTTQQTTGIVKTRQPEYTVNADCRRLSFSCATQPCPSASHFTLCLDVILAVSVLRTSE